MLQGNLYGTTSGHYGGNGVAFKINPRASGNWSMSVLHIFAGGNDGLTPYGGLVQDTAANLYGTTGLGGGAGSCPHGCGIVYELSPQFAPEGEWAETILHRFNGKPDGANRTLWVTCTALLEVVEASVGVSCLRLRGS